MSGVPRSQALIQWNSDNGTYTPVWTSPAGYITLLKSAYFYNGGAAAADVTLNLASGNGNVGIFIVLRANMPSQSETFWQGWLALNPGDQVFAAATAVGVASWISGAVLAGGPQFPIAAREVVEALPGG